MNIGRRAVLAFGAVLPLAWSVRARGQQDASVSAEATGACPADRLDRLLADIARARASITTLTGPFTQERTIGLLAAKVKSTGTLTLVRHDRLRWELAPPDDITYWVTPEGLAYKSKTDQGRAQGATGKAALALEDLRILLAGDLTQLRARYDLRGECPAEGPIVFDATPKDPTHAALRRLRFSLAPDLVSPLSVTIVEGPRDRTEIRFGTLTKNAVVDPAQVRPGF